jgi:hypothetical protein
LNNFLDVVDFDFFGYVFKGDFFTNQVQHVKTLSHVISFNTCVKLDLTKMAKMFESGDMCFLPCKQVQIGFSLVMLGMVLGLMPHFMGKTILGTSTAMITGGLTMLALGACNTTFTHNGTYAMAGALATMFYSLTCLSWRRAKGDARGRRFVWGICVLFLLVMFHNRKKWLPDNLNFSGGGKEDPTFLALFVLYYIGILPNWANCIVSVYIFNQNYACYKCSKDVFCDPFAKGAVDDNLILLFLALSVMHFCQCLMAWKREGFRFP